MSLLETFACFSHFMFLHTDHSSSLSYSLGHWRACLKPLYYKGKQAIHHQNDPKTSTLAVQ